jgi:hypothetical protein
MKKSRHVACLRRHDTCTGDLIRFVWLIVICIAKCWGTRSKNDEVVARHIHRRCMQKGGQDDLSI